MANENTEIVLKLSIDNKDYEARIAVSKQEMVELAKATGISEKQLLKSFEEMQKGMDKTAASVDKIKSSFEKVEPAIKDAGEEGKQFGYNLGQDFDGVNVTLAELSERLDDLKERFGAAAIGSEEYNHLANEIQVVQGHLQRVKEDLTETGEVTNTTTAQTGALRSGVTQVGWALRDLDPRLGSVVQGLSPFINGFNTASMRGGGFKQTLTAITGQLTGPLGIGLAITGVALLLRHLSSSFEDNTETIKKNKEEVDKLKESYKQMSKEQLDAEIIRVRTLLSREPSTISKGIPQFGIEPSQIFTTDTGKKLKEQLDYLNLLKSSTGDLLFLENRRKELNEKIADLRNISEGLISPHSLKLLESYKAELKSIDERINGLTGQEKDKTFERNKRILEIAQNHSEKMIAIETQNDLIVEKIKIAHLAQMIELYKKYGQDYSELQLDLKNKELELEARANAERKELADKMGSDIKDPEDIQLKIATQEEIDKAKANSIENRFKREHELLNLWREQELARYADDAAMKAAIDAEYLTKKNELQHAQAEAELQMAAQTLNILSGMINENTAVGKALAVTTAIINTYEGASKAIAQGGIFGPALAAMVVAAGMANVSKIVAVNQPKMKGYATGGILEPGKAGFFEGTHKEIIAPEKDFISVVNDLVARSQIAIAGGYSGGGASASSAPLINKIDELNDNIKKLAERPSRAFLDNDEAMKIGDHYDYETRRSIG